MQCLEVVEATDWRVCRVGLPQNRHLASGAYEPEAQGSGLLSQSQMPVLASKQPEGGLRPRTALVRECSQGRDRMCLS
jgi:hypothetical protein